MLNVNEIAARIENPSITKANDAEDFKLLAEKYPYTQMFSILYLQSLKQAGDVHFEDELKKHSFRITDRAQLFNLIESAHSVSAEPTPVVETEQKAEELIEEVDVIEKTVAETVNEDATVQEEISQPSQETVEEEDLASTPLRLLKEDKEELVSEGLKEEVVEEELVADIETPSLEEETIALEEEPIELDEPEVHVEDSQINLDEPELIVEDTPLEVEETTFETETPDSSSENKVEQEELYSVQEAFKDEAPVEEEAKDPLEQTIAHHIYAANYQLDGLSPEEEQKLKEKEAENEKEKLPEPTEPEIKEDLSFTSWLSANDNYTEPKEEVVTVKIVPGFSDFDPSNPLFGEQERPKKEFFSAPKKAKKSLTEETVPVSETLAKVYAMQGNYPKAISAYEQLMLTIPEKKSFFASLIEDLKTKLNT